MGIAIMSAAVSLDGFVADLDDAVGPLFDWYGNGEVTWTFHDDERAFHTTHASAEFMLTQHANVAAAVIGRRLFDLTNGWHGRPAAGEHVFVVTHKAPTAWDYADEAPFTFVDDVRAAITQAREYAGDRDVTVTAGNVGGQALRLGLIDRVVMSVVPVVFGSGRPFFGVGGPGDPVLLADAAQIIQGSRVTHVVYDIPRARIGT
ncbi:MULTISPECIES: dihydrofolate reductase family protein [Pseudofrankia]|uniref:dihydrofolate reductase family protein n=1 Tax=Pseudofrankia TaxID=2994363 RepID=UPI000234D6D0|nr:MULTISPECIES: dihydrofolate reductase family protein [Pseudofrankia]OHV29118.1 hypothetical protein BCD49_36625 [Pseudofrankia sp. EUN1h]